MLNDTRLNDLARIYRLNPRLAAAGVSFEAFAADPSTLLRGSRIADREDPLPLLPAQRIAAARIAAAWLLQAAYVAARAERACERARLVVREGRWFEPLHHRTAHGTSHPGSWRAS
jgi:hypothetical protein